MENYHFFRFKGVVWIIWNGGCKRYLTKVSVLATVDGGQHALGLEKQRGAPAQKLSNVQLWTGSAAKHILATYQKTNLKKSMSVLVYAIFRIFSQKPFSHFFGKTVILPRRTQELSTQRLGQHWEDTFVRL